jgi:LuxR family maltose regulon positive regulatory protein
VAELTELTEGWPAGLYLAALSLRASSGRSLSKMRFSSDRYVSEYLRSEVLAHLSRREVQFLTRTSILDRLNGPLCDAVLERSGSAEMLESIARLNLFLMPLDAKGGWYRYHQLFQSLLRTDLEGSGLAPALALRASAWCEANGMMESAIGYAHEARDPDRLTRLISLAALPTYRAGRIATALRWFEWLEADELHGHQPTSVIGAWIHALVGQAAAAARWAEAAETGAFDGSMPDGSPSIEPWRAMLRAALCRGGVAAMLRDAREAREGIPIDSPWRGTAMLLVGIAERLTGDLELADDTLGDTVDVALDGGGTGAAMVALGERAFQAIDRADWLVAASFAEAAAEIVRREGLESYLTSAIVFAASARVAIHQGDLPQAREHLARATKLRPLFSVAIPWFAVRTLLGLAGCHVALGDLGGARTLLSEAEALLRRRPDLGTLGLETSELRARLSEMPRSGLGATTLTAAEIRLLPLLATHLSFREIGARLFVSSNTVKTQAISVYRKLATNSRGGAVEQARKLGLIEE